MNMNVAPGRCSCWLKPWAGAALLVLIVSFGMAPRAHSQALDPPADSGAPVAVQSGPASAPVPPGQGHAVKTSRAPAKRALQPPTYVLPILPLWNGARLGGWTHVYVTLPLVASAVALAFALGALLRRLPVWKKYAQRKPRKAEEWGFTARAFLMVVLGISSLLAVCNYVFFEENLGFFRFNSFFNAYEFYHYYIGTKYAGEVGYTHMYSATLVADDETGMKFKYKPATIRNLATGDHSLTVKQVLADRDKYKALFSQERWAEFVQDIQWFKNLDQMPVSRWSGMLRDKGYNSTPVWSMVAGGLFSNRFSTRHPWQMMFLALLDPILIAIATGLVVWAFGPRAAMYMLVLLGTHYVMHWWHMKGAFLRTDFAMCLVMTVCLVKKEQFALAGALTGWAILSRVFPVVFLFGIGAKVFWEIADTGLGWARIRWPQLQLTVSQESEAESNEKSAQHDRRFAAYMAFAAAILVAIIFYWPKHFVNALKESDTARKQRLRQYVRYFMACALLIGTILVSTIVYWRGFDLWNEFISKISRHNVDISTWRLGFKYLFMGYFDPKIGWLTPFRDWTPQSQSGWYGTYENLWWSIQGGALLLALIAARGLKPHQAVILGFVPCFFLASATYYYFILLLVPFLFFAEEPERLTRAVGMTWMYLTGIAGYAFYSLSTTAGAEWKQNYGTYYWTGWMIFLTVLWMLALALHEGRGRHTANLMIALTAVFGWGLYLQWPLSGDPTRLPVFFAALYGVLMIGIELYAAQIEPRMAEVVEKVSSKVMRGQISKRPA